MWARVRPRASHDPETWQAPHDLTAPDTLGRPDTGSGADDVPELHVSSSLRVISPHEWPENKLPEKGPLRLQGTKVTQLGPGLETFLQQLLGVTALNGASMSISHQRPLAAGCPLHLLHLGSRGVQGHRTGPGGPGVSGQ